MNNLYLILRNDLIEHFDYEAVNQEIWQYFKAWYGTDLQVLRFIKCDNVNRNQLFLELYPEKNLSPNTIFQK